MYAYLLLHNDAEKCKSLIYHILTCLVHLRILCVEGDGADDGWGGHLLQWLACWNELGGQREGLRCCRDIGTGPCSSTKANPLPQLRFRKYDR